MKFESLPVQDEGKIEIPKSNVLRGG